jgi:hypothetical protein
MVEYRATAGGIKAAKMFCVRISVSGPAVNQGLRQIELAADFSAAKYPHHVSTPAERAGLPNCSRQ